MAPGFDQIYDLSSTGFKVYISSYDIDGDTFIGGDTHQWTLHYKVVVDE